MILPTAYLGPSTWMTPWLDKSAEIEVMESFEKQTFRNRCQIRDMQGRTIRLSVPVCKVESKQRTQDIEISYQQRWQHQHWEALRSAYKHTPYFDYYAEYLQPWYEKETRYLVDLNEGLAAIIAQLLGNQRPVQSYPTHQRTQDWSGQVWTDSHPWQQELSIVDSLFRWGPEALLHGATKE